MYEEYKVCLRNIKFVYMVALTGHRTKERLPAVYMVTTHMPYFATHDNTKSNTNAFYTHQISNTPKKIKNIVTWYAYINDLTITGKILGLSNQPCD